MGFGRGTDSISCAILHVPSVPVRRRRGSLLRGDCVLISGVKEKVINIPVVYVIVDLPDPL